MKAVFAVCCLWITCCQAGVYEEGLAAKKGGRHEQAAELLVQAVATQPGNVEAWFHYGTVLGWLERHDEALQALERGLALAPKDFDLRMAQARVWAWKADYAAAERRLAELDAEFPGNTEVQVLRGRVAGWRGDPKGARRLYEAVLNREPQQVDALTGLGDLEAAEGELDAARVLFERAVAVDPAPDNLRRLEELQTAGRRMRLDFGLGGSTFARGERADWWNAYLAWSQALWGGDAWLRYEHGRRFGFEDESFELGYAARPAAWWRATVFGGFSPDASYSAEFYGDAALHGRLWENLGPVGAGWLLAEGRHADYDTQAVTTLRLGWEQELAAGWTVNARWLHFFFDPGGSADGWQLAFQNEPRERWLIRFGAGQAVESITRQTLQAGNRSLTSWTLFASLVVPVSERWHVRLDLEREEVRDSVIRHGLALGAGRRF